jgi:DNA-binding CsgD family transcriptional regulator
MPVQEAPDRRGRAARGGSGLLERKSALNAITAVLDSARDGTGDALLLEGHAGMGKTRLHEAALDEARLRGLRVLRAAGAELEINLAYGVAGRLLGALLDDLPAARRVALLRGAPPAVRSLVSGEEPTDAEADSDMTVSHGIFSMLATADETRPVLLAIDDLHCCDTGSLTFVVYVLHRLAELPVAVVLGSRPGRELASADVLDRIASHPAIAIEKLLPLGAAAVQELVRGALGERADVELADICRQVTAGNPFYLRELLLALGDETELSTAELGQHALALAPEAVARTVRVRVGRLGEQAAALARAIAILGDDIPLRLAAALAGLSIEQASAASDRLAAVEILLAREPLRFVHSLVARAIDRDVPASERAGRHLDAARLLYADGEGVERVAAHLLLGRAQADPWVVEQLRAAARDARARAAAQPAVRYLERALEEPPSREVRAAVLAELGDAEAALGLPAAASHLAAAAEGVWDPIARAQLALQRGNALFGQGLRRGAAESYDRGLQELGAADEDSAASELHDALQTGFVATASTVPGLHGRSVEREAELLARAAKGPDTQGQRMLLARAAVQSAWAGEPATRVAELAELAWDQGRLLEHEGADGVAWSLLSAALTLSGALERSVEVADVVLEDARRRASPLAFANASYCRAVPYLWQGRVADALADLELADDARRVGWRQFTRAAAAVHCLCQIETGALAGAADALDADGPLHSPLDVEDTLRLFARAELRLAQGDPRQALEDAIDTGTAIGETLRVVGPAPWRTTAAQAALALGDRDQALTLAREELAVADRTQVPHARIRALRVLGICEGGSRGTDMLTSATELGAERPPRLETIRALVELGAALRRGNQRSLAREPLQRAADAAGRGGATVLYERARVELAATGARPRRDALLSGPASLTPSERRIAVLAAAGQSNREIAVALFVTPKTVEYHLRNAYRKLDITSRHELARALAI